MNVLFTFDLRVSNRAGIGLADLESGESRVLALEDFPDGFGRNGFRGASIADGERLFAVNAWGLFEYRRGRGASAPLERAAWWSRPEWRLGPRAQGDLMTVHASPTTGMLHVVVGKTDAVDVLDLNGVYQGRSYLWDRVPGLIPSDAAPPDAGIGYAAWNHLFERNGGALCGVLGNLGGTGRGAVVDLDAGRVLLDGLRRPHGGLWVDGEIWVAASRSGEIRRYDPGNAEDGAVAARFEPATRGRLVCLAFTRVGQELVAAFSRWTPTRGSVDGPRLVRFGAGGEVVSEMALPVFDGGDVPVVHAVVPCPDGWASLGSIDATGPDPARSAATPGPASAPDREPDDRPDTPKVFELDGCGIRFRRRRGRRFHDFWALRDLSLDVHEGEVLGIVGRNGSGKSTLAKLLAGIFEPDSGRIMRAGRPTLLALGTGFRGNLTARENVFLAGAHLHLSRAALRPKLDEIIAFAGVEDAADEPLRHFSSGMRARLAFSIATALPPDVLILDEALSAGDASFRERASRRLQELLEHARAVIVISHQLSFLSDACSRVAWLDQGRLVDQGDPERILAAYRREASSSSRIGAS